MHDKRSDNLTKHANHDLLCWILVCLWKSGVLVTEVWLLVYEVRFWVTEVLFLVYESLMFCYRSLLLRVRKSEMWFMEVWCWVYRCLIVGLWKSDVWLGRSDLGFTAYVFVYGSIIVRYVSLAFGLRKSDVLFIKVCVITTGVWFGFMEVWLCGLRKSDFVFMEVYIFVYGGPIVGLQKSDLWLGRTELRPPGSFLNTSQALLGSFWPQHITHKKTHQ